MKNKAIKLIAIIFTIYLIFPTGNVFAETLKDYKDLLDKYIAEQKKNQANINKTDNAIEEHKDEIESIKKQIQDMDAEIELMRQEVIDFSNEIKDKSIETKELFKYLQISQTENLYLEYAFDAETLTDLIYRVSVIEQITDYNEKKIKKLEEMIEDNKNREIELDKKQEEMAVKQEELAKEITNLTGMKASFNENAVSVSQQIKIYQELVDSYKKQGCKDNDVIGRDCAVTSSVTGWYRPIESGYVTSEVGPRWGGFHKALDVSNKNPYSTKIYPVADGTITAIYKDYYGALTVVIEHRTANGQYYSSLYTHMSKYSPNIYVGKKIKHTEYIGYMGATGNAQGPHLHFSITPCRLYNQSDKNCGTWEKYEAYAQKIYYNGTFKGPRDLIYFPSPWVTFNGR